MKTYIYHQLDWPNFIWDAEVILPLLSNARLLQGKIIGRMEALGFDLRNEAVLETLTLDALKTSEIEGHILDSDQVRSSIARRLGMDISGLITSDRDVDGLVDMMFDAVQQANNPLSEDRLFNWHTSLFPSGRSGMYKIKTGIWRDDSNGPMQVVSGALGNEKVHYQAPNAKELNTMMSVFLDWFNANEKPDFVLIADSQDRDRFLQLYSYRFSVRLRIALAILYEEIHGH